MDYFSVFTQMLQAKGLTDNTIRSYKTYIIPYLAYLSAISNVRTLFLLLKRSMWRIIKTVRIVLFPYPI